MKTLHRPAVRLLLTLVLLAFAASCRKTSGAAASFDRAVDKLFGQGYPKSLEDYFCSLGTNPDLGFRWAGTSAERAVSDRVAAEMRAMGLSNVRLEPVPVDVFEFKTASLIIDGRGMVASTIAGVPPTPEVGVTGPVVYVRSGTSADFDAAGDVTGKIVLIDMRMSSWWFSLPAFEAGHRHAAAVVCTFSPEDRKYFSVDDRALGSFDGQYDFEAPPWIFISRRDGDWLKSELKVGSVRATVLLKEKVTHARNGGRGFNVVGELPGSSGDGRSLLVTAHQDAHFRAGADDTGALAGMLAMAKAMRASRYRPKTTIIFMATTGEEFGYTDTYYDWLTGAWWAATRAHPDWSGRVRAMLNLETMAVKGAPLTLRSNPELRPWLAEFVLRSAEFLPNGAETLVPVNSWNDQWTFTAAGIPSVKIETWSEDYDKLYHSNFETSAVVDWGYLAKIAKFVFRAAARLDDGLLPYSLKARADDLASAVKGDELMAAGAHPTAVSRLVTALDGFRRAAGDFDGGAGSILPDRVEEVNSGLLEIEKILNSSLTALSPPDDDATIYPHELVLRDTRGVTAALAALKAVPRDRDTALKALAGTSLTRLALAFSYPVYLKHLERLDPDYKSIAWGAQGRLPKPLDVFPEYRKIEVGQLAGVAASLEAKRHNLLQDLNRRLDDMSAVLELVTPVVDGLARK